MEGKKTFFSNGKYFWNNVLFNSSKTKIVLFSHHETVIVKMSVIQNLPTLRIFDELVPDITEKIKH